MSHTAKITNSSGTAKVYLRSQVALLLGTIRYFISYWLFPLAKFVISATYSAQVGTAFWHVA